jgi:hypothetical protein
MSETTRRTGPPPGPVRTGAVRGLVVGGWIFALAASLTLLWVGVYDTSDSVGGPSTVCVEMNRMLVIGATIAVLGVAGMAWVLLHAGWWSLPIALPAIGTMVMVIMFPCSYLPAIALPVFVLIAVVAAVVSVVRYVAR